MEVKLKELFLSAYITNQDDSAVEKQCHTDVIALMEEPHEQGRTVSVKYLASFFTYDEIPALRERHQKSGEFLDGAYFYARNMVLVETCNFESVRRIVEHLLEEGEFQIVFQKIS